MALLLERLARSAHLPHSNRAHPPSSSLSYDCKHVRWQSSALACLWSNAFSVAFAWPALYRVTLFGRAGDLLFPACLPCRVTHSETPIRPEAISPLVVDTLRVSLPLPSVRRFLFLSELLLSLSRRPNLEGLVPNLRHHQKTVLVDYSPVRHSLAACLTCLVTVSLLAFTNGFLPWFSVVEIQS